MEIKKYAAIDIGSNGVRLLVNNVILKKGKKPKFKKSALVRVPIRLGADTFTKGVISNKNTTRLNNAMKAFKLLMEVHGVIKYRACATSAMREAKNASEVIKLVAKESGINIDIIDGKTEASIIAATDLYEVIEKQKNYLYVDVGGGSSEFTFFHEGKPVDSKSFKMGSVRSFEHTKGLKNVEKEIKKWVKNNTTKYPNCTIIGSGGNINKIYKISDKKLGKPLEYCYLKKQYKNIKMLSYEDRIREMGLNPDRADVIVPALKIYLSAMKWSNADEIIVPQIGLADGIIKILFQEENSKAQL